MSRISAILLCGFLLLVALASIAAPGSVRAAYIKLAYDASLQETPQDAGMSLAMLPADVVVTITGDPVDGYYPVTAGGKSGWVRGDALAFDEATSEVPAQVEDLTPASDPGVVDEPVVEDPALAPPIAEEPAPLEPAGDDVAFVEPVAGATPVAEPPLLEPAPADLTGTEAVLADPVTQTPSDPVIAADDAVPAFELDPNAPSVAVPDPGPTGPAQVVTEAPILAGPGPDYGVLGTASGGALVEQTGHAVSGYVTVRYVGVTGWMSLDTLGPPAAATNG